MKWPPPSSLTPILIHWIDASHDSDQDAKPRDVVGDTPLLMNIGFFVKKTKDAVVLASCLDPKTGTVRWIDTIPLSLVRKIELFQP